MVRLRDWQGVGYGERKIQFQFHDGPIERLTEKAPDVVDAVFQFHDGPIESLVNYSF